MNAKRGHQHLFRPITREPQHVYFGRKNRQRKLIMTLYCEACALTKAIRLA